jgi:uncharacterized paraquat-inducible protein A
MAGKIDTMKRLRVFGDFLMLGSFLMLLWLFISAYMSNSFSTTVHINNYGEAHVEMIIMVFFLLPLFLLTTALSFLDWRQTWKAKGRIAQEVNVRVEDPGVYTQFVEESLVCPSCLSEFTIKGPQSGGHIMCPRCGEVGWYEPQNMRQASWDDHTPKVKILKDIK